MEKCNFANDAKCYEKVSLFYWEKNCLGCKTGEEKKKGDSLYLRINNFKPDPIGTLVADGHGRMFIGGEEI